jgi:hypothetical protein
VEARIKRLVEIISASYDNVELETIQNAIIRAYKDIDLFLMEEGDNWLIESEYSREAKFGYATSISLIDFINVSDKIDELHDLLTISFEEDFPSFPQDEVTTAKEYFIWFENELKEYGSEEELVLFGDFFDDSLCVVYVLREETQEFLNICKELELTAKKAVEI